MTPVEFESIRPLLNISDDRVSAARAVLVDDDTYQVVAQRYEWSRQAVGDAVNVVWRTLQRYQAAANTTANIAIPEGWEQVTLIAPRELIAKFRKELDRYGSGEASTKKTTRKRTKKEA
ncbi:TrfB-related DNA-binding protein [Candidatus Methylobacter favarea]|nr:TrfB-related DNA-binding protein [Candidatus Methylobacter favarea]